jgi:hypothetical protein
MKRMALVVAAATLMTTAPLAALAAMEHDHGAMKMENDHGAMKMDHDHDGMMAKGKMAHEEVVDGVKVTFKVMDMREQMKDMPKGMKETHHIMLMFKDAKSGKALNEGEVRVKVFAPDKSEQTKDLMGMGGHFGADFAMTKPGKYGVMAKFKMKDGKVRTVKFHYTVK